MDPKKLFVDDRLKEFCIYCSARPNTRDHVPSRVLLDEPYPENLPVVESCSECNNAFSIDEEYLACLIECVIHGTTEPNNKFRNKVIEILKNKPLLKERIQNSKRIDKDNNIYWQSEIERIKNVILKLSRGHLAYELNIYHQEVPDICNIYPVPILDEDQWQSFNNLNDPENLLMPEVGSRAFLNLFSNKKTAFEEWYIVQPGKYRYMIGQSSGDWVKIVLSEYLACEVVWH